MTSFQEIFTCTNCGAQHPKWSGRCLECGSWSSLEKEVLDKRSSDNKTINSVPPAKVYDFSEIKKRDFKRLETGISELDRVFGGGIVPGSLVLIAGEPGVGKSTLIAQLVNSLLTKNKDLSNIYYFSGEESGSQVLQRMDRLSCNTKRVKFLNDVNVEKIISAVKKDRPSMLVVDSIQTIYTSMLSSEPGSVSQIRASTSKLMEFSKHYEIPIILVGHITKDGSVAGPKTLEHMVDAVFYLETDNSQAFRILRTTKNRFGSTREVGIFEIKSTGLEEVKNPALVFLDESNANLSGSVLSAVMEGTRPFLLEVQALVSKTSFGYPQRKSSGFDLNRLQVISAVMSKRTKINLINQDIILNIVGGMRISDHSIDLAICMAIASSYFDVAVDKKTIILGELGLGGELRTPSGLDHRLSEAEKLGFKNALIPNTIKTNSKIKLLKANDINEAIKFLFK